jgi:hypothetical protein
LILFVVVGEGVQTKPQPSPLAEEKVCGGGTFLFLVDKDFGVLQTMCCC